MQNRAIRYADRLAECDAVASVGSKGDSYDNAMAEALNSLYKAELVRNHGPWESINDLEYATAEWVDWWNERRLHGELDHRPPAEVEADYWAAPQPQFSLPESRKNTLHKTRHLTSACLGVKEYGGVALKSIDEDLRLLIDKSGALVGSHLNCDQPELAHRIGCQTDRIRGVVAAELGGDQLTAGSFTLLLDDSLDLGILRGPVHLSLLTARARNLHE